MERNLPVPNPSPVWFQALSCLVCALWAFTFGLIFVLICFSFKFEAVGFQAVGKSQLLAYCQLILIPFPKGICPSGAPSHTTSGHSLPIQAVPGSSGSWVGIFPPHPSLSPSHNRKAEAVERNSNGNKAGIVELKNLWLQPTPLRAGIMDTRMNPSFCLQKLIGLFLWRRT